MKSTSWFHGDYECPFERRIFIILNFYGFPCCPDDVRKGERNDKDVFKPVAGLFNFPDHHTWQSAAFARTKDLHSKCMVSISLRWPSYLINSNFLCFSSPPLQHHSFFTNWPLYSFIGLWWSLFGTASSSYQCHNHWTLFLLVLHRHRLLSWVDFTWVILVSSNHCVAFESVDEVLGFDHSNENYWVVLPVVLFVMLFKVVLTFESGNKS